MYMDISQFVSETIKQICIGIKEAKEACKEKNDPVAPVAIKGVRLDESVQMIHFDICAVATEEKKGGGGISIQIPTIINGEIGKNTNIQTSCTQRIQFSSPFIPSACSSKKETALSPEEPNYWTSSISKKKSNSGRY